MESMRDLAIDKIARMSARPHDLVSFWQEATEVIGAVLPYYWTPCWYTLDPASLLITSHYHEGLAEFPAEWLAAEYYEDDVNKIAGIALSGTGISTLHEATSGDPSTSPLGAATSKWAATRNSSPASARAPARCGAPSACTASRNGRCSTSPTSASSKP